jgi:salicylate hydroxylase
VNYVLRGGEKFNMVLLVPDDIPEDSLASTVEGNVQEMCALFEGWDPR